MIPIAERFYTFQGEGMHVGRAAFFIRTFGCPLHCPWCDSAGTWHPDYIPKEINRMSEAELAREASETNAAFVVVTGGEPAIHDLTELTAWMHEANKFVHIETSGAYPLRGGFDWVTLSPKRAKAPLRENVEKASEIKLIIERPGDIPYWVSFLEANGVSRHATIWLHPEWSQRANPVVLKAITEHVKIAGDPFRAGWQMHKLYQADALDNRAAKLAPLGGNPALGY